MQKIFFGVIAFIVLIIVIGLALPRHAEVRVETEIDAHPATVFALLNDFHRVSAWSPLLDPDPNARVVFSGPTRGVGATMTWDGAIVGSGTMVISESRPYEHVSLAMNAGEAGAAESWFDLRGAAGKTVVTWGFSTDYGFNVAGRFFGLAFAGVVERDYKAGLERLRQLAESLPRADFSDLEIERIVVEPQDIAYLPTTSAPEPGAISEAMGDAYFEILGFIDRHGLSEAGAPLSITRSFSGSQLLFDAAIPVRGIDETTPRDGATVRIGQTDGGSVIRVRHVGSYRTLGATHAKIAAYLAALDIERAGNAWEAYVSDPTRVPEQELLTYVYYPIRQ